MMDNGISLTTPPVRRPPIRHNKDWKCHHRHSGQDLIPNGDGENKFQGHHEESKQKRMTPELGIGVVPDRVTRERGRNAKPKDVVSGNPSQHERYRQHEQDGANCFHV